MPAERRTIGFGIRNFLCPTITQALLIFGPTDLRRAPSAALTRTGMFLNAVRKAPSFRVMETNRSFTMQLPNAPPLQRQLPTFRHNDADPLLSIRRHSHSESPQTFYAKRTASSRIRTQDGTEPSAALAFTSFCSHRRDLCLPRMDCPRRQCRRFWRRPNRPTPLGRSKIESAPWNQNPRMIAEVDRLFLQFQWRPFYSEGVIILSEALFGCTPS